MGGESYSFLSFSFFNLAALFNSSPPNAPGGNGRRGRNAHNGVKRKLAAAAAAEEEENRPVLRNIHRFQGCRFFSSSVISC